MDVPMPFYQLVCLSFLSAAVCSLTERIRGGPPYNLRMESRNFQHILSWQAKNDPAVPTSYNVLYRHHGNSNWTTARQCSGTAQLSCDLTEDFKHRSSQYYAFVQSIRGTEVLNSSMLPFAPLSQTLLGPPEVNITPCLNCINVTIKLPTSHYREKGKLLSLIDIYEELDYQITLKSQAGEHKTRWEKTTEEVFSTVIEELYPSRNYCVSVVVAASLNKHSIPSPWKCVPSDAKARPGYHVAAVASAVCFSLVIAVALKCLHAGGYFLQSKSLPRALESIRRLVYLPWIFPSEEVDSLEVIPREVQPKAGGCSSSDSDSEDSDGSALWDHDYTRREVLSRAPPAPGTAPGQYSEKGPCEGSGTQGSGLTPPDPPRAEEHTEPAGHTELVGDMELAGHTDTGQESLGPDPEPGCLCPAGQSGSACFTISLQSVLLGSLEERGHGPAPALPARQHKGLAHCAPASGAEADTGTVQKAPGGGDFQQWQNSASEEESDSSESDTDLVTGYMRR